MASTYTLKPVGLDSWDARVKPHAGCIVRKVQPGHGAPRNGTMGHCYVERVDTGEFIGLVLLNSLVKS